MEEIVDAEFIMGLFKPTTCEEIKPKTDCLTDGDPTDFHGSYFFLSVILEKLFETSGFVTE
jgi:hypothetical protein